MPIEFATPPEGAAAMAESEVERGLEQLHAKGALGPVALGEGEPTVLSRPHAVHTLGLRDIVEGRGLAEAPRMAWRFLVERGGRLLAATEVSTDEGGRPAAFGHLNYGPFVEATARAQAAVEDLPEVRSGRYEVRLLKVPALYVVALWLVDQQGDRDLVVPMDPAPPFLQAHRLYAGDEFLQALQEPARSRLAAEDPRLGG